MGFPLQFLVGHLTQPGIWAHFVILQPYHFLAPWSPGRGALLGVTSGDSSLRRVEAVGQLRGLGKRIDQVADRPVALVA